MADLSPGNFTPDQSAPADRVAMMSEFIFIGGLWLFIGLAALFILALIAVAIWSLALIAVAIWSNEFLRCIVVIAAIFGVLQLMHNHYGHG